MSWRECWAFAVYDLGLSPADAGRLTPAEFALLQERHSENLRREELFVGMLYSALVNPHRPKGKRPISPHDIFPALRGRGRRSPEEMFAFLAKALGAKPEARPEKAE